LCSNSHEWADLDLFGDEEHPLGVTHPLLAKALSKKELQAQNIIYGKCSTNVRNH
jgi:hypothetical protein